MNQYPRSEDIVYQDWTFASNAPSNWSQLTSILNRNLDLKNTESFDTGNIDNCNKNLGFNFIKNNSYSYTRDFFARKKLQRTANETKTSS